MPLPPHVQALTIPQFNKYLQQEIKAARQQYKSSNPALYDLLTMIRDCLTLNVMAKTEIKAKSIYHSCATIKYINSYNADAIYGEVMTRVLYNYFLKDLSNLALKVQTQHANISELQRNYSHIPKLNELSSLLEFTLQLSEIVLNYCQISDEAGFRAFATHYMNNKALVGSVDHVLRSNNQQTACVSTISMIPTCL